MINFDPDPIIIYRLTNPNQSNPNYVDFNQWLTALSSLDGYAAAADADEECDENESSRAGGTAIDSSSVSVSRRSVSVVGDDDIQVLYTLLRLVCTEHGHRWVTIDLDPTGAASATQSNVTFDDHFTGRCASASDSDSDSTGYRLHEPSSTAVRAYCHLLTACCRRVAAAQRNRPTHAQGTLSPTFFTAWGESGEGERMDLNLILTHPLIILSYPGRG